MKVKQNVCMVQLEALLRAASTYPMYAANKVRALLRDGAAHINDYDDQGWTALHWASFRGCLEAAEVLLENGASVDQCANDGQTPLSWAAITGRIELVELLLENGADMKKVRESAKNVWERYKAKHEALFSCAH